MEDKKVMNVPKLLGLMAEHGISRKKLAKMLNITELSLRKKLKGEAPFKDVEIKILLEVFNIRKPFIFL